MKINKSVLSGSSLNISEFTVILKQLSNGTLRHRLLRKDSLYVYSLPNLRFDSQDSQFMKQSF